MSGIDTLSVYARLNMTFLDSHWYSARSSRSSQQFSWRGYDLAILALYPIGPRSRPQSTNGPRVVRAPLNSDRIRIPAGPLIAPENPKSDLSGRILRTPVLTN